MSKQTQLNDALIWVMMNTPSKDVEGATWVLALWGSEGNYEMTHKDHAYEILNPTTIFDVADFLLEAVAVEDEAESAKETMVSYF